MNQSLKLLIRTRHGPPPMVSLANDHSLDKGNSSDHQDVASLYILCKMCGAETTVKGG
ncbi:hypothetical protein VULLAG_LOCUS20700 [Vulpes lagopus]